MSGYAIGDRYTAVATYTGTATSSYVTGYTVTADYTGTDVYKRQPFVLFMNKMKNVCANV